MSSRDKFSVFRAELEPMKNGRIIQGEISPSQNFLSPHVECFTLKFPPAFKFPCGGRLGHHQDFYKTSPLLLFAVCLRC